MIFTPTVLHDCRGYTLLTEPEGILEAVITALALEDIESTLAYFDQEADFTIFTPGEIVFKGREAIARRLHTVVGEFHVDRFVARTILPCEEGLRTQIAYAFRHREVGATIDGTMRVIASFRDGRIVRWHEYQDAERVEAFMRLVRAGSTNK